MHPPSNLHSRNDGIILCEELLVSRGFAGPQAFLEFPNAGSLVNIEEIELQAPCELPMGAPIIFRNSRTFRARFTLAGRSGGDWQILTILVAEGITASQSQLNHSECLYSTILKAAEWLRNRVARSKTGICLNR